MAAVSNSLATLKVGTLTIDSLNGLLKATTGVVSVAKPGIDYALPGAATSAPADPAKLAPPFVYAVGGLVNYTVDSTKATQALRITATGDVSLKLNGAFDGANGVVVIGKQFDAPGSFTLPAGGQLVDGAGASTVSFTGPSGSFFAASFHCDKDRSYWATSAGSGAVTVVQSAPAGGVTLSQLQAASGALQTPAQVALNGGTALSLNTIYRDTLAGNRKVSFVGTAQDSSFVVLRATVATPCTLEFPSSQRVGLTDVITKLSVYPGSHEFYWLYSAGKWWLVDSVGTLNNYLSTSGPTASDDVTKGYGAGSELVNVASSPAALYKCINATAGAAVWLRIQTAP